MAQQTAVGWLTDQIKEHKKKFGIPPTEKGYMNLIDQAKEIEKRDIIESWNDGNLLGRNGHVLEEYSNGEQYYNKTYNK